ncbi:cation:proton antiporter [Neorhodopirellula pilleata]|uniref:K(+)/H(+) antiporter NhaP n=1 Tax=Neorhodopirellula pilleata TaxID=2714738 RepID=A0A5C6A5G9_9BACT|nr:cation:proton antiporter [Neorhodopirellula pilleata]TWT94311.1 K(+)/H(+) antiporter NhaP [Neorhodopirellula pilleata]
MIPLVAVWSLIIGSVFLLAALGKGVFRRLPISLPAVYLLIGVGISDAGLGLMSLDLVNDAKLIETLTEIGVLVSLLTVGLRLVPSWSRFRCSAIPLASVAMVMTIAGVAAVGYFLVGLPIGAAVLLGAVLAPTDPVLASEVQINHDQDTDQLRYSLTGEAGLNDGTAFPFVMLGLGLVGIHDLGEFGWRWVAVDLVWAVVAGCGFGAFVGYLISHVSSWLKSHRIDPIADEELLTLAMIGLAYGGAIAIHAYGFLSVFAAGVAMRVFAESDDDEQHEHAETLMRTVASVNQRFGEILEVALVVLIGVLLPTYWTLTQDWWFALLLFAVLRPIASYAALWFSDIGKYQKRYIAFFGIRGIGSLYYLSYSIDHGLDESLAHRLGGVVLTTIALSLLIHSNIASLLLSRYQRQQH